MLKIWISRMTFAGALICAWGALAASPSDPAKEAAAALVAQGCKIERETPRFIAVSCPGQPMTRIMRMPQR